MKHAVKRFFNYFFLILGVLFFLGWITWYGFNHYVESIPNQITDQELVLIKNRLEDAKELTTMKYHYTNMGHFEKQKAIKNWKIPFTESKFMLTYSGVIHTGVDLEKLEFSSDGEQLVVEVPQAKILAHEVNEDSVDILDEDGSIFNPIKVDDVVALQGDLKKEMENEALANGLLTETQNYSQNQIKDLITDMLQAVNPEIQLTIETAS
ncbi:DUF4230 domain-containing protein [Facklamia sp. 7083-14-GEN3]|uniref:DUF4230 domain-containing protein n=1 Tax=Facklamia sp. 7083-14-GEN3 TaxID=2973478 RepID=UPI00215C1015|nr:DUF4230 domain-containing protein [Facklamia sp. 7083-14-GEN3]MCR8968919.1 DUF4230 domain-containing protein [Facklamia sp. 7083-14-GEN3]